jgi:hypothetical protein
VLEHTSHTAEPVNPTSAGKGGRAEAATYVLDAAWAIWLPAPQGRNRERQRQFVPGPRVLCVTDSQFETVSERIHIVSAEGHLKIFTAREITSATVINETPDWARKSALDHRDRGIVSVGLNAMALVKEV